MEFVTESDGDMDAILDRVMCSSDGDEERFVAIIHAALTDGTAEPLDAFVGECCACLGT